jgi:phosphoribosylformimino-5-aminoimidazole carboxamide ribotide isomerase
VWGFLYTNINVEGKMGGIDAESVSEVISSTAKPVIISGGITCEDDIKEIASLNAWAIVVGKALYEGRIDIKDFV